MIKIMKGFIKTWWHCFKKLLKLEMGHRMCHVKHSGKNFSVATYFEDYWICKCKLQPPIMIKEMEVNI